MRPMPHTPAKRRPASRVVQGESSQHHAVVEVRLRLLCVAVFFGLFFAMLALRLIEVSLVGTGEFPFKRLVMQPQLLLQHEADVDVSKVSELQRVTRREVVDRNGMVLATSIETASLVANPTIIQHEPEIAAQLHRIFPEESYEKLLAKLNKKASTFVYIRRHLSPAQQEAVNNLGVPGLFFESDARRVYPYGGLFAHTLGYVGVDNQGLAGIEKHFDVALDDPAEEGPLQLSLDLRVQSIMRDELAKAVEDFRAIGATGIVLDIPTGEVIAMANLPEFDPNKPGQADDNARFNRATLGVYEMGSTFKTFAAAAALDAGTVTMRGGYDAAHNIRFGRFTISDAHPEGRWLSVPEIIAYSSNIGAAKMALDLGGAKQRAFLQSLGFFEPLSVEVPERGRPMVPKQWSDLTTMTVSYGHGIAVSPLHLVRAIAAVAGDGYLHPVTLLKGGNAGKKTDGKELLKASTREEVRQLLRVVVKFGTGKSAEAVGYQVAGKTGTAEKQSGGKYQANAKVASFVGVFPAYKPRYAILVMVDEPKGNKSTYGFATGGWVSAPVVGRVVQRMAPLMGMVPDFAVNETAVDTIWADSQNRAKAAEVAKAQQVQKEAVRAATY